MKNHHTKQNQNLKHDAVFLVKLIWLYQINLSHSDQVQLTFIEYHILYNFISDIL